MRTFDPTLFSVLRTDKRLDLTIFAHGCVKMPYKGFVISIGADGETVEIEYEGDTLFVVQSYGNTVASIIECVRVIDNNNQP